MVCTSMNFWLMISHTSCKDPSTMELQLYCDILYRHFEQFYCRHRPCGLLFHPLSCEIDICSYHTSLLNPGFHTFSILSACSREARMSPPVSFIKCPFWRHCQVFSLFILCLFKYCPCRFQSISRSQIEFRFQSFPPNISVILLVFFRNKSNLSILYRQPLLPTMYRLA